MFAFLFVLACLPTPATQADESGSGSNGSSAEDTPAVSPYANCEAAAHAYWTENWEAAWYAWTVFKADGYWWEYVEDADADGVAESAKWAWRDEDGRFTTYDVDDDDPGLDADYRYQYEWDAPSYSMVLYGDWGLDGVRDAVWYYTADEAGRTIRVDYDDGVDGDIDSLGEHTWTERDGGWIQLYTWDTGNDGVLDHIQELRWDAADLLVEYRDDQDADGTWESQNRYEYDDDGAWSAYEFESYVAGELDYNGRVEQYYDEFGRESVRTTDYYLDGTVEFRLDVAYDCE